MAPALRLLLVASVLSQALAAGVAPAPAPGPEVGAVQVTSRSVLVELLPARPGLLPPPPAAPAHHSLPPALCRCAAAGSNGSPRVGGYTSVDLPNAEVTQLAEQALQTYLRQSATPGLEGCQPDASAATARVLEACSQVVAGRNLYITFQADIPCAASTPGAAPSNRQPVVEAAVFVPLPYLNALPTIKILEPAEAR